METEFVNPNLHVVLVHFPLALLIAGTLIELFSFMWRRHAFRAAGRWMILLGALSSVPTALSGVYALYDVANPPHASAYWNTLADTTLNEQQWEILEDHLVLGSFGAGLALIAALTWIGCSDGWRMRLHLPMLAVLAVGVGLMMSGAWHGGEAVYAHGIGVGHAVANAAATQPTTLQSPRITLTYFIPPLQTHVILAGTAAAIALAALALSVRRVTQGAPATQLDFIAAALGPAPTLIGGNAPEGVRNDPPDLSAPYVPAARFWLLAALLLILTAATGWWGLALGADTWSPKALWNDIIRQNPRQTAHVIVGGSMLVLALFLAAAVKWAPRQKWLLVALAILLLVAIAFQAWLGILMMYDTPDGSPWKFN